MASARNWHTPSIQTAVRGSIGSTASLFSRGAFCVAIEFGVLSEVVFEVSLFGVESLLVVGCRFLDAERGRSGREYL
jgi:hypothetical protein